MPHCNFESDFSSFHFPLHAWLSNQAASSMMYNISQESSWSAGEMWLNWDSKCMGEKEYKMKQN